MFEKLSQKTVAASLALSVGVGILSGCSTYESIDWEQPVTIQEHHHTSAYTSLIPIVCGKGCITLIPIYHAEEYDVTVKQCDKPEAANVDKEGCMTDTKNVSKDLYNQLQDGETVVLH